MNCIYGYGPSKCDEPIYYDMYCKVHHEEKSAREESQRRGMKLQRALLEARHTNG